MPAPAKLRPSSARLMRPLRLAALALFALVLAVVPLAAQERVEGFAYPEPTDRFGRIIFEFAKPVAHEIEMTPGVLVISFEEPVSVDVSQLADRMSRYVGAARIDPDGRAVRVALAQALVVNKMEAAEKIFVDLLPSSWQGLPPPLPAEVVAELARRAEEAERKAFLEAERLRRLENAPKMEVRVAEAPTFSRISFNWSVNDVKASVTRERDLVKVTFDTEIEPNIDRLKAQPPKHLVGADWERIDGGTIVLLRISPDAQVRSFNEESAHVVDLSLPFGGQVEGPQPEVESALSLLQDKPLEEGAGDILTLDLRRPVPAPPRRDSDEARAVTITQEPLGELTGETDSGAVEPAPAGPVAEMAAQDRQSVQPAPQQGEDQARFEAEVEESIREGEALVDIARNLLDGTGAVAQPPLASSGDAEGAVISPRPQGNDLLVNPVTGLPGVSNSVRVIETARSTENAVPSSAPSPTSVAEQPATPANPVMAANEPARPQPSASPSAGEGFSEAGSRDITSARVGNSLRLTVPFDEPSPAAVFQRAGRLWAVFESELPFDVRVLRQQSEGFLRDIEIRRVGDVQIIKSTLAKPLLLTVSQSGNDWVITLGDMIVEPLEPVGLVRGQREDGGSIIVAQTSDIGNVYWFDDDVVGDRLAVVTLYGPPRGFLKDQTFVEFSSIATAQGMAFVPTSEDVAVRANMDQVVVSREEGLTLSGGSIHQYVPGRKSVGYGARPGQIEYTDLVAASPRIFFDRLRDLMAAASKAKPEDKSMARMEVARFMLANDYVMEALGIMRMAAGDDPLLEQDPAFNIMRGVASTLAGRIDQAKEDLSVHGLDKDPDAALWRALVAVEEGQYRAAQLMMEEGKFALNSYPSHVRLRFHLAAVRADIATRDLAAAMLRLDVLETETLDEARRAEARLYRGQVLEMMGRQEEALEAYAAGLETAEGPVRAESLLRKTALETQMGRLEKRDAIEELERLALSWRGDDIEINTLRTLGQYYVDTNNHREAFRVLKAAVVADEGSEYTRLFQDEMSRAFVNYFLGPEADAVPALEALALYYDHREMTPIGRQGDEIIRRLADRLVEVDLLAQATELLEYQIENRLRGAGRSQVAARLAYVHLLNKDAEEALRALQRTRQNVLPDQLQRERNLLEARALADLGRTALALELLRTMEGEEVDRLEADTLWRARRWQEAAEHIELSLASGWQGPDPLTDAQRYEVLRGAVAFALAGDDLGLQRYRAKFAAKMSDSPDANAFAVVTEPINIASPDFQNVAREIADVDTLQAFLKDFRERYGYAAQGARKTSDAGGQRASL